MDKSKKPSPEEKKRIARQRMRDWRAKNQLQARRHYRRQYWKKHGLPYYDGVQKGGDEVSDQLRAELRVLREKIHRWNFEYYVWSAPSVSDAHYDRTFDKLKKLEAEHPELHDDNSPTLRIGHEELSIFAKIEHKRPMLSLEKAKTAEEIVQFFKGIENPVGMVEPKIDGSSLSVFYVNGRLVRAVTRGNGSVGDEVTMNAKTIRTLPLVLPQRVTCEVRGEVFIRWSHFQGHNMRLISQGDEPAANPRNAAAGALKLKDSRETAKVPLGFIAYTLIGELEGIDTHAAALERLEEYGFIATSNLPQGVKNAEAMTWYDVDLSDLEALRQLVNNLDGVRKVQDFPTDGLVFKLNSLALQQELGDGTTAPKWAVAFKYAPEQVETTITKIVFTVGKTGKITPVAEFKPVLVSGTKVSRASLCNKDEMVERLGVSCGDLVLIEKSNEIIPKVVTVVKKCSPDGDTEFPTQCPNCKSKLVRPEGMVDIFCQNPYCGAQRKAKLVYATGKSALDIKGCGEQTIVELIKLGVKDIGGLLAKTGLKHLKSDSLRKTLEQGIAQALRAPLWRKLAALCIEGWGDQTCQEAAARWPSLEKLLEAQDNGEMKKIVGPVKVASFRAKMESEVDMLAELGDLGFWDTDSEATGPLAGQVFCITGTLDANRDLVADKIMELGGLVKGMSKKVHYLVVGSSPGASKLSAAKRLGTRTITQDELFEMMNWRPELAE